MNLYFFSRCFLMIFMLLSLPLCFPKTVYVSSWVANDDSFGGVRTLMWVKLAIQIVEGFYLSGFRHVSYLPQQIHYCFFLPYKVGSVFQLKTGVGWLKKFFKRLNYCKSWEFSHFNFWTGYCRFESSLGLEHNSI